MLTVLPIRTPLYDVCQAFGCDNRYTHLVYDSSLSKVLAVCEKHVDPFIKDFDKHLCCPNCQCHIGIN